MKLSHLMYELKAAGLENENLTTKQLVEAAMRAELHQASRDRKVDVECFLFIGGEMDGERMILASNTTEYQHSTYRKVPCDEFSDNTRKRYDVTVRGRKETYKLYTITGIGPVFWHLMVHEGMTNDEALGWLVGGYRKCVGCERMEPPC